MNEYHDCLPPSWTMTSVHAIAESIQYGLTESAKAGQVGPKFLRITDIQHGQVNWSGVPYCICSQADLAQHRLEPGDIVFARTGATTGKSFLIRNCPDAVFASYLIRLRLYEHVDVRYLAWFLNAPGYWSQISNVKKGSAQPGVNATVLATLRVPLAPLPEQQRIVAEIERHLSRLDAAVVALERVRANLKRYRAAVLRAACEGRLVPTEAALARREGRDYETAGVLLQRILCERRSRWEAEQLTKMEAQGRPPFNDTWKAKYREPSAPNTSITPEPPEGWAWANVEQAAQYSRYGSSAKTSDDHNGVPVLRMGNIQDGKLDCTNLKYLPSHHSEFPDLILANGDLLFNRTNSAELVGKSAVYKGHPSPCSYASYLIAVRLLNGLLSGYLCYWLNSSYGRAWVRSVVTQQVGQANVNGTKLLAMNLPVPPVSEQERIVAEVERRLSIIEEVEAAVAANLKRAERLRQAILQRAFSGKLVPQDPNDEPAGVLLERIRAERETGRAGVAKATRKGQKRSGSEVHQPQLF